MAAYNDFLIQDMLTSGTVFDEVCSQPHNDDRTGPLHHTAAQLQWPSDG